MRNAILLCLMAAIALATCAFATAKVTRQREEVRHRAGW